jgi:hypothetical protein
MKRNKVTAHLGGSPLLPQKQQIAFHEAGHAAGMYLNNKARGLTPVFFKIHFKDMADAKAADVVTHQPNPNDFIARVEGGRLFELAPFSPETRVDESTAPSNAMVQVVKHYMRAIEADITNMLIGPLAEAKYVADTDNELFNHQLVSLNALKNYGGSSDLALAKEYLQRFYADKQQKYDKLDELFTVAFSFISNDANWAAISNLANYILAGNKNDIGYEEIVSILDQSVADFQNRETNSRFIGFF